MYVCSNKNKERQIKKQITKPNKNQALQHVKKCSEQITLY